MARMSPACPSSYDNKTPSISYVKKETWAKGSKSGKLLLNSSGTVWLAIENLIKIYISEYYLRMNFNASTCVSIRPLGVVALKLAAMRLHCASRRLKITHKQITIIKTENSWSLWEKIIPNAVETIRFFFYTECEYKCTPLRQVSLNCFGPQSGDANSRPLV
uniref:Uncharacterized protein n=1 Tax=Glossina pallidipes TaxID=7398 RepID=A0A1A9ZNJ1_GLOPL